jgi:hypothetical protein
MTIPTNLTAEKIQHSLHYMVLTSNDINTMTEYNRQSDKIPSTVEEPTPVPFSYNQRCSSSMAVPDVTFERSMDSRKRKNVSAPANISCVNEEFSRKRNKSCVGGPFKRRNNDRCVEESSNTNEVWEYSPARRTRNPIENVFINLWKEEPSFNRCIDDVHKLDHCTIQQLLIDIERQQGKTDH